MEHPTPYLRVRPKYLLLLAAIFLSSGITYGQTWVRQPSKGKPDSIFAVYAWEAHDEIHAGGGEISLLKNGRFHYTSFRPLNFEEHAEGTYRIRKGILILNSDLRSDNLKVRIDQFGDAGKDSLHHRLGFPVNMAGDTLHNTYYLLNGDTSHNGHYDPWFPSNIPPLTVVKKLKVMFYDTNWGSAWIPVSQQGDHLAVTVLTDVNAADRTYKVIENWRFRLVGDRIVELRKKK